MHQTQKGPRKPGPLKILGLLPERSGAYLPFFFGAAFFFAAFFVAFFIDRFSLDIRICDAETSQL